MNKYILMQEIIRKMHEQQDKYPLVHDIATPFSLVEEIIESTTFNGSDTIITFNLEFAIALVHKYNVESKRITIYADFCPTTEQVAAKLGINYIDAWNYNMEFDVLLGNPPFSETTKDGGKGRGTDLYPIFFKNALAAASTVAMIMPTSDRHRMKDHNDLLKQKANSITYIPSETFKGVNIDMWYVIVDGSDGVPDINWAYDDMPKNNINWTKGKCNVTCDKHLLKDDTPQSDNDIEIFHKIGKKTGLITKYARANQVPPKRLLPKGKFAVLMPQQITPTGWKAVEIVECNGKQAAMNGMNIALMDSREEAERLIEYMSTEDFINEALKYVGGMGNMVLWAMKSIDMSGFENVR